MEVVVILAIVQARMASNRLPGKVMKQVLGKPLIGFLLERLKISEKISKIVVATSREASNDPLCAYVESQGVAVYRGSEEDVLDRFYQTALREKADTIVRVTADCPLMDYKVMDSVIDYYEKGGFDYVSNTSVRPAYPDGMDIEIFSFPVLEIAWEEATLVSEREHVTPFIKKSGRFRKGDFTADQDYFEERWTVDNEEDLRLVENILQNLYRKDKYFDMRDILEYKKKVPSIFQVNRHISRNEGYAKSLREERPSRSKSVFIREREGAPAPSGASETISFCPEEDENYFLRNTQSSDYYALYDSMYSRILASLDARPATRVIRYRGVDIAACFKKSLFEYANDAAQRYRALNLVLEKYPSATILVENLKNPVSPHLSTIIGASPLDTSMNIRRIDFPGEAPTRQPNRYRQTLKQWAWPRKVTRGKITKAVVVLFSDYEKVKSLLSKLARDQALLFTYSRAPKLFFKAVRNDFLFRQVCATPFVKHSEVVGRFIEAIETSGLFQEISYKGLNIGRLLRHHWRPFLKERLPRLLSEIDEAHDFFKNNSVRSVLVDEDISFSKSAFCDVARQYPVVTFVESHGALGIRAGFLPLTADYILAWGNAQKAKLVSWACEPERIKVTGCSRYASYSCLDEKKIRKEVSSYFRLDPKKKMVLLAFSPIEKLGFFYDGLIRKTIHWALEALKSYPDVQFIVKVHPGDRSGHFYEDWRRTHACLKVVVTRTYDPMLLAKAADFLVTYMTTYAVDGFAMGKDVICLRDALLSPLAEFDRFGIFRDVWDAAALCREINALLSGQRRHGRWEEARRECLNEFPGEPSPQERIASLLMHAALPARESLHV